MRNATVTLLAAATLFGAVAPLNAAPTQAQQQAIRSACQSDYRSYCASVPTGGSAALQCLQKNVAKLSSSCQQAVNAASGGGGSSSTSGESGGSSSSSQGSGSTSSSSESAGGAGTAPTNAAPQAESGGTPPVVIVLQPGQEIAVMRQACGADYRNYCSGTRIIGGAALRCLVSHRFSLSPSCKGALSSLGQKL